jgi:hypothetical protein
VPAAPLALNVSMDEQELARNIVSGLCRIPDCQKRIRPNKAAQIPLALHPLIRRRNSMTEHEKESAKETNEPWKRPDRSDHHPTKDDPPPRPRTNEDNKTA